MDIIYSMFAWPVLPATIVLGAVLLWSIVAVTTGLDLDLDLGIPDVPAKAGGESLSHFDGLGVFALRWLNVHRVPVLIWGGLCAILWWGVSMITWLLIDQRLAPSPSWLIGTLLVAKNLFIAALLTKFTVKPLGGNFESEHIHAFSVIGKECTITSSEATPDFGQVRFKTDGAPLLLNVRTDGEHLAKGTRVWITHYDEKRRVYLVTPTGTDSTDET